MSQRVPSDDFLVLSMFLRPRHGDTISQPRSTCKHMEYSVNRRDTSIAVPRDEATSPTDVLYISDHIKQDLMFLFQDSMLYTFQWLKGQESHRLSAR